MKSLSLIVLLVVCMAGVASANWNTVGGMNLGYSAQPGTPAYSFPYGAGPVNNVYGGVYWGGQWVWPANGGTQSGVLSVDNSIGSYDAYITQTIAIAPKGTAPLPNYPTGTPNGPLNDADYQASYLAQQFISYLDPGIGTGQTGIWMQLSYGAGTETDSMTGSASGAWQNSILNVGNGSGTDLSEFTIKIGILKDPSVTTGTRVMKIEDLLMASVNYLRWSAGPYTMDGDCVHWDNWTFDVPEPATMALLGLGGAALLRRRRSC